MVCVLPGSRDQERRRMLPIFGEALRQLARDERFRNMFLVLPTLPDLQAMRQMQAAVDSWGLPAVVLSMEAGSLLKNDAFEVGFGRLGRDGAALPAESDSTQLSASFFRREVPPISNDEEFIHTACSQARVSEEPFFLSCRHQSASASSASSISISFSFRCQ